MDCPDFKKEAGDTWEEKAEAACSGCERCHGNFPLNPAEVSVDEYKAEIEELVSEIEDIVEWSNTSETDWNLYPFEYYQLFNVWINTVKEIERIWNIRQQAQFKVKK